MEMSGEQEIPAPVEKVWQALNDADVLQRSIPGCETLVKHSETEMSARVRVKFGPMVVRFSGKVVLSDIDVGRSYRISGEGEGGAMGFARGTAEVTLVPRGEATLLCYAVKAQVGGKIAQLGARLVDTTAKWMADQFFARFAAAAAGTVGREATLPG